MAAGVLIAYSVLSSTAGAVLEALAPCLSTTVMVPIHVSAANVPISVGSAKNCMLAVQVTVQLLPAQEENEQDATA